MKLQGFFAWPSATAANRTRRPEMKNTVLLRPHSAKTRAFPMTTVSTIGFSTAAPEQADVTLSPAEAGAAIRALSIADKTALMKLARLYARKTPYDHEDLLQEAMRAWCSTARAPGRGTQRRCCSCGAWCVQHRVEWKMTWPSATAGRPTSKARNAASSRASTSSRSLRCSTTIRRRRSPCAARRWRSARGQELQEFERARQDRTSESKRTQDLAPPSRSWNYRRLSPWNCSSDHMQNLADALSEDIVATPAAVLLAEVAEARGDRHAFAVDFDRIVGRAERRARWRGIVQRLRAMLPSLALRSSWRPALAAVACLAVIVVAGDLYLHVRPVGPTPTPSAGARQRISRGREPARRDCRTAALVARRGTARRYRRWRANRGYPPSLRTAPRRHFGKFRAEARVHHA